MNKKEKQQIKYLLKDLKWYAVEPNVPDYSGEYPPPMEWEQGDVKLLLKYLEERDKEIERLNNIIKELKDMTLEKRKYYYEVLERYNKDEEMSDYTTGEITILEMYLNKLEDLGVFKEVIKNDKKRTTTRIK